GNFPFMHVHATDNVSNAGIYMDNTDGVFNCIFTAGTASGAANVDKFMFEPGCGGSAVTMTSSRDVGVGNDTPLTRLHVGPGNIGPVTAGASLMVQEGQASSMILKSTSGPESVFYQDQNNGLFVTASNTPEG